MAHICSRLSEKRRAKSFQYGPAGNADKKYYIPNCSPHTGEDCMSLKAEVIEKISALLAAAFGLIAALAWNGAIQELFAQFFGDQSSLVAMFVYAIVVTIIAVIAVILIGRAAGRAKAEDEAAARR